MRFLLSITFALLSASTLVGCGPEKTAVEREKEQYEKTTRENVDQTLSEITPLVGKYWGLITYTTTGRKELVSLDLFVSTQIVNNPSRNETIEIPILAGTLKTYEGQDRSADKVTSVYSFNQSKWTPETKKLILYSDTQSAEGGRVRINMNLDAEVLGARIFARLSTSLMMNSAEIEVTRE